MHWPPFVPSSPKATDEEADPQDLLSSELLRPSSTGGSVFARSNASSAGPSPVHSGKLAKPPSGRARGAPMAIHKVGKKQEQAGPVTLWVARLWCGADSSKWWVILSPIVWPPSGHPCTRAHGTHGTTGLTKGGGCSCGDTQREGGAAVMFVVQDTQREGAALWLSGQEARFALQGEGRCRHRGKPAHPRLTLGLACVGYASGTH
eukprot:1158356-Pelagomonas_calceolata.AAC.6